MHLKNTCARALLRCFMVFFLASRAFFTHASSEPIYPLGLPFAVHYNEANFKAEPQTWSAVQDLRGVMYFGGNSGVLTFNGKDWKIVRTKNQTMVRSLAMAPNGRIFFGAQGEFGYIAHDSTGSAFLVDLTALLVQTSEITDIRNVVALSEGVYFYAQEKTFFYDYQRVVPIEMTHPIKACFVHRQAVYALTAEPALHLLAHGKPTQKIAISTEHIPADFTSVVINDHAAALGKSFFISDKHGIFLFDGAEFLPFRTQADAHLAKHRGYSIEVLPNGLLAVGTVSGGLLIFTAKGRLSTLYDSNFGLTDNAVLGLYTDAQHALWILSNTGISHMALFNGLTYYTKSEGIDGIILSLYEDNQFLYAGTYSGTYVLQKQDFNRPAFQKIEAIEGSTWNIIRIQNKHYAATDGGVYELVSGSAKRVASANPFVMRAVRSLPDGYVLCGMQDGALLFNAEWERVRTFPEIEGEVRTMAEDADGTLWLGTFYSGLYRLRFTDPQTLTYEVTHFSEKDGLSDSFVDVYQNQEELFFATSRNVSQFVAAEGRFVPTSRLGGLFAEGKYSLYPMQFDEHQRVLMFFAEQDQESKVRLLAANEEKDPHDVFFQGLRDLQTYAILFDSDSSIWFGGSKHLYRFDARRALLPSPIFHALITRAQAKNHRAPFFAGTFTDSAQIATLVQPDVLKMELPFKDNGVQFEFSSSFYPVLKPNEYQYRLWPLEPEWSAWSERQEKEYTYLPAGTYVFEVRVRNVFEQISQTARFEFSIAKPWYAEWWAWALWLTLGASIFFGVVRINTYRLKVANRLLENEVRLRTAEILQSKKEIEAQRDNISEQKIEIERRNNEIKASIQYALRIQEAILPRKEEIQDALPHSFVFFRPRDVVSGDFYWFHKTGPQMMFDEVNTFHGTERRYKGVEGEKILISAVDCTGHGVPGAFMSMLGETLLNQIVARNMIEPQQILQELDAELRKLLRQEKSRVYDGMDMALCMIDQECKLLHFAGAKNPLYAVRHSASPDFDRDFITVKASKLAIGGQLQEGQHFEKHTLSFEQPTSFYIASDGFQDQFGGETGRKFMLGAFKKLLFELSSLPMTEQRTHLEQTFEAWKGSIEQIDDVLVIGFKLS